MIYGCKDTTFFSGIQIISGKRCVVSGINALIYINSITVWCVIKKSFTILTSNKWGNKDTLVIEWLILSGKPSSLKYYSATWSFGYLTNLWIAAISFFWKNPIKAGHISCCSWRFGRAKMIKWCSGTLYFGIISTKCSVFSIKYCIFAAEKTNIQNPTY